MVKKKIQLDSEEEILFRSCKHPAMFYGGVFYLTYMIVVGISGGNPIANTIFISAGAIWTLFGLIKWTYTEYILTNKRLVVVSGYFYLRAESIPIDKIEHVTVYQTLTDKWWNKGILTLFGIGIQKKRIKGLKNAEDFRDAVHSQLSVDPEPYFSN
ncbi:PH domain-containing protein [Rhodohalobacter sp.]|uniref:PH domain-containing protein n=1 Tax=Rhodohalobacter sp. TaxID=1974210 RepID=UPI002ACDE115|nr:PH domain-containing protein [Rhodohalobacter sp.]MDZ7758194.1 PH domain-containing protein [Rhodohalobacter sp.]